MMAISVLCGCKTKMTTTYTSSEQQAIEKLNANWVLENLNGKKVTLSDFQNQLPRLEMNTKSKTFTGFGGCNPVDGSIVVDKKQLQFSRVIPMSQYCSETNKEGEYLETLKKVTNYSVVDNQLSLSDSSGVILVFNKR
jgi:heat shock protein HslJ